MTQRDPRLPVPTGARRRLLTTLDLARQCGLHPQLVQHFFALGLLDPEVERPEPLYPEHAVVRIRKIVRIRHTFGGSYQAAGLIVELAERVADLERCLDELAEATNRD